MKLILAQGNPGQKHQNNRHNSGFMVLDDFAKKHQFIWQENARFQAEIAKGKINGQNIILAKPTTFYNETGQSARAIVDFYKLQSSDNFLLIHDDLAISFGSIRVRQKGSDGGNNGVKSINAHIGQDYWRIRIGIGNELNQQIDDADFVLSNFSKAEAEQFKTVIQPLVIELVDDFVNETISTKSIK